MRAAKLYLKGMAQLSADVEKEVKEKVAQLKSGQQKGRVTYGNYYWPIVPASSECGGYYCSNQSNQ